MTHRVTRVPCALLSAWLTLPLAAFAQLPPTPGTITEGLDGRRAAPAQAPAEFIFQRDAAPSTHAREGRRFLVKGFQFVGNTVFTEARLRRVVERYTDLELNLNELNRAADAVTRFYRDLGYPVAGAFVPVQRVADGLVVIQVIEGRIGRLGFDGGPASAAELLTPYLGPVLAESQVTIGRLERSLLLMNDLPGLQARATLAPGARQGDTDVAIAVEEKPVALTLQYNNSGRKEAGQHRYDVALDFNNTFGIGDQINWRHMESEHKLMQFTRFGYSVPLGADGLRLSVASSRVRYKVAGDFAALGIEGLVDSDEVGLSYPLRRSRVSNITLSGGIKATGSRQSALSAMVSSSKLPVATFGVAANWVHEDSSSTNLSTLFSSNFRNNYGNAANALRGKVDIDFSHLAGLTPRWDVLTRVNAMLGAGAVPDTEKFSLGGPDSVRGYRVSEFRGDRGFLLTVEFRRQFALGGMGGQMSIYHDRGAVNNSGFAGQDHLASWGVGAILFPGKDSRIRADVAWPASRGSHPPSDGKSGARLWLSASVSF